MRFLAASLFALGLVVAGCKSTDNPPDTDDGSGGSGDGDGGTKGSGGKGGAQAKGGTGGAQAKGGSGGSATGGSGGEATGGAGGSEVTGGSGGSGSGGSGAGGSDQPDAAVADATAPTPDASTVNLGGTLGTHPWVIPCPTGATRAECCMHYCTCMMTNCPGTLPANCVATCSAPDNKWNLKCRVEQCFEALNPKYPADKGSHCGHAVEKPPKCQGIIP